MNSTKEQIVLVRDLRPGDYLPASRQTIIHAQRGAHTTAGKHEVAYRRDNGKAGVAEWNSNTRIKVVRSAQ